MCGCELCIHINFFITDPVVLFSIPSTSTEVTKCEVEVKETEESKPTCQSVGMQTVPFVRNARVQVSPKTSSKSQSLTKLLNEVLTV